LNFGSADATYFVSGLYDFENIGAWTVNNTVFGGQPNTGDVTVGDDGHSGSAIAGSACAQFAGTDAAVTSAIANAFSSAGKTLPNTPWARGTEWVFSGNSTLNVGKTGILSLYSPTPPSGEPAVSFVAARADKWFSAGETKDSGSGRYLPVPDGANILSTDTKAQLVIDGKLLAPDADVSVWGTNGNTATLRGGLVGKDVDLQASASVGSGNFLFQVSDDSDGSQPPPARRTVRIVATVDGSSTDSGMTETAVATIDNFGGRPIRVYSWRVST
jgi:hypothetical protein